MALIQVNFFSQTLMRTVPMQVILPVDKMTFPGMRKNRIKPCIFCMVYLEIIQTGYQEPAFNAGQKKRIWRL